MMRLGKFVHNWPRALAAVLLAASVGLVTVVTAAPAATAAQATTCHAVTLKWTASEGPGEFDDVAMYMQAGGSRRVNSLGWEMKKHYRFTGGVAYTHNGETDHYGPRIGGGQAAVHDWFVSAKLHATNCRR